jgi:hypothetical protein
VVDQLTAQLPEHRYTALAQIRLGTALSHLGHAEFLENSEARVYSSAPGPPPANGNRGGISQGRHI